MPASILSAGIVKIDSVRSSTPLIVISSVPAPEICAPMEFKNFARSSTSGSFATLRNIVCPFAKTAAIIIFSVPVTDIPGKLISHPINFFALASM